MPENGSGVVVCSSSLLLCSHPGRRQAETPLIQPVQKSRASSVTMQWWVTPDVRAPVLLVIVTCSKRSFLGALFCWPTYRPGLVVCCLGKQRLRHYPRRHGIEAAVQKLKSFCTVYRPRFVRHRIESYAASAAGESWFCRT